MTRIIYGLTDTSQSLASVFYVGMTTKPIKVRVKSHVNEAIRGIGKVDTKKNRKVAKLLKTDSLNFVVLEQDDTWTPEELAQKEKWWIAYFKSEGVSLANLTDGGDGTIGYKFSKKQIKSIKSLDDTLELPVVFKDLDDKEFVRNLFRKTVLNELEFAATFENKTPNWDKERIAEIDTIILKMAICELLKFPSIPIKVTLNEYLEIAKEYSTPKSSIFINGILDNLVKDFQAEDKIKKAGRGLL